jgi:hypothetical protein
MLALHNEPMIKQIKQSHSVKGNKKGSHVKAKLTLYSK